MTPSDARRAQLEALAKETAMHASGGAWRGIAWSLMTPNEQRAATVVILDALLRADASPPAALPAETPRAETCATCRFYGDVCYHGIGIPLAGPETFGCILHEPQASRAVEGAAEPLAHIDHAQDGSAE